ncbi:MAG: ribonuclease P protein component [Firmicutes bacterium]|nr:ribonuclease P protein component [Bacillota bacterium]
MLPAERRLRTPGEFQLVYQTGKIVRGKYLTIRYLRRKEDGKTRFGFAPARVGSAVLRNRLKRRLRELCRKYRDCFRDQYDVVVNIHRAAASAPYEELEADFLKIFSRARLIRNEPSLF